MKRSNYKYCLFLPSIFISLCNVVIHTFLLSTFKILSVFFSSYCRERLSEPSLSEMMNAQKEDLKDIDAEGNDY